MPRAQSKLRTFDPARMPDPKYFTRIPDDALEDPGLTLADLGAFAQMLKGNWTSEKTLLVTMADLAKRCRLTIRRLRVHLSKFEQRGYITRSRDLSRWGAPCQITLTYELRPTLEMAPNVPVAKGSNRCTHGTKTSHVVGTKTSHVVGTKTSHPLLERLEEREKGGEPVPVSPKCDPPSWDSQQQEVIELATQRWGSSNGDYFVGDLLRTYSAELVMEAIDRHWDKVGPGIRPPLLRATCVGMFADGWKPETGKPSPDVKSGAKTYGILPGP